MMGGRNNMISEIIDVFLQQVPEELQNINEAVSKTDYPNIKKNAHSMKSSLSIMGISILVPILNEMENLGTTATNIEEIIQLNQTLNLFCMQAIEEIQNIKHNYV